MDEPKQEKNEDLVNRANSDIENNQVMVLSEGPEILDRVKSEYQI